MFDSKSRFSPVFLTYSAKVMMTPMFISINLLKQFTELWETFYLLDDQFFVRGCNSGTSRWKRCSVHGVGRGMELPHPEPTSRPKSPRVHPPRALWTLSFWVLRGPSLHSHDQLNHWPLMMVQLSAPLWAQEVRDEAESYNPPIAGLDSLQPAFKLWLSACSQKVSLFFFCCCCFFFFFLCKKAIYSASWISMQFFF